MINVKFWLRSGSRIGIRIRVATLVRRALAEVCTVPVLLVLHVYVTILIFLTTCISVMLLLFTHRRSVAKRGGCFQRRPFVCQYVCLLVRTIPSQQLNVGWWNLALRCTVRKSRPSLNVKVKGQGYQGQKTKNCWVIPIDTMHSKASAVGGTPQAATDDTIAWPPGGDGLRRWENQRMLSIVVTCFVFIVLVAVCEPLFNVWFDLMRDDYLQHRYRHYDLWQL